MKRIVAFCLSLLFLFSLGACAAKNPGGTEGKGTESASLSSSQVPGFDTDTEDLPSFSSGSEYNVLSQIVTDGGATTDSGAESSDIFDAPGIGDGADGIPEDEFSDDPLETPETPETPSTPDTPPSSGSSGSGTDVIRKTYDPNLPHRFLATDIRNHSIVVFDLNACDGNFENLKKDSVSVIWEWDSDDDPNCKIKPSTGIDAAKFRYSPYYKKDVIIACSSNGWAGVIDYEKKKLLWEYKIGDGPHSIELMPDSGDIVVGCSSGSTTGKLAYVPLSAGKTSPSHTIPVPSCHGVMWDPQKKCLWVLEYAAVFACKVTGEGTVNAKLTRDTTREVSFAGQDASGHAFTPVYGEPGKYWVSAGKLWQFDSNTLTLTRDFNQQGVYNAPGIKGVAGYADGTVITTIAGSGGNTAYNWSCGGFRIITMEPSGSSGISTPVTRDVIFTTREFYKVHPFIKDYQ